MCRNIKPLFNFDPPATAEEIHDASLQFVRKLTGFNKPSQVNDASFNKAVDDVAKVTQELFNSMITSAAPKDREIEAEKARKRSELRFDSKRK